MIPFLQDHEKTAFYHKDQEYSYRQILSGACDYARQNGVKSGERVMLCAENRPEWACAFYSAWKNGAIPVPCDFMSTPEELAYILDDSTASAIFVTNRTAPLIDQACRQVNGHKARIINMDEMQPDYEAAAENIGPDDTSRTAVIIYTSGTTGNPKGVMLSYDNILTQIRAIAESPELPFKDTIFFKRDRTVAILPMHHILPLMATMVLPMYVGVTVSFIANLTADDIFEAFQKYKPTYLIGVPRLYEMFHGGIMKKIRASKVLGLLMSLTRMTRSIRVGRLVFGKVYRHFGGSLEKCVCGGAALPDGMAQDFRAFGLMIMNGYGMTETSPMITYPRLTRYRFGSVGYKLNNTEVKIDDNGEILVRGPHVMQGYYKKPQETAEIMRDGWLHTGDKGRFDRRGFLYITGRIKNIIVLSNGKNINPEELEGALVRDFALVKEAAVIDRNDQLVAIIYPEESEVRERTIINIEETIRWEVIDIYNRSAAHHKKISDVIVVDRELPKTRMGKIRRHELTGFLKADRPRESAVEVPVYEEYEALVSILAEISGKDVRPDDHIELDLGLDSLDKVELQVRIEGLLGVSVGNEDLAAHGRVAQLAEFVRASEKHADMTGQSWGDLLQSGKDAPIPRSGFFMNLVVLFIRPTLKLYFRFTVRGLENIPRGVPVMFAPNHLSHLDGLMLAAALPRKVRSRCYYFAKDRNFNSWWRRLVARNSNIVLLNINRELKDTIRMMGAVLHRGRNVVIFPEGARSRDGKLHDFKKTFAIVSREMDIQVVPVAISGTYQSFSHGSKIPRPSKVTVEFLPAVAPGQREYDELAQSVRTMILEKTGE